MSAKELARCLAAGAVSLGLFTGAVDAALGAAEPSSHGSEERTVGVNRTVAQMRGRKAGFCRAYARRAVRAQETNERFDCGFTGLHWHLDEEDHFQWCLDVPRERVETSLRRRRDRLQRCRERDGGGEGYCRAYARRAVRAQETNRELDCGFTGPRWHPDTENHYQWCLNAPRERAELETETRREQLEQCRLGENGRDDAFCQTYARRAVDAQRVNEELGCGFTGPRWTLDKDVHYEWCLNVPRRRAENERQGRRAQLARCRRSP